MTNQPTAIYFKNERTVITVTGKRFLYDGPSTVLVY